MSVCLLRFYAVFRHRIVGFLTLCRPVSYYSGGKVSSVMNACDEEEIDDEYEIHSRDFTEAFV